MPTVQRGVSARSSPAQLTVARYSPDAIREAFGAYFHGAPSGDEQPMYCPLCEDPASSKSASASINAESGEWNCLKTPEHGGGIPELVRQMRGRAGFSMRARPTKSAPAPVKPKAQGRLVEDRKRWLVDAPERLHTKAYASLRTYLQSERGLTPETVERFKLGATNKRITIPVEERGALRNVRRYLPNAPTGQQKFLNLPGHGSPAVLAFTEVLADNALPVILCEGEFDALLVNQHGTGRVVAVTGTGGAGTPPRDLSALSGREVFVAYDADDAGRKGAEKAADLASAAGATAYILDVSRLGMLPDSGGDLTDFFQKQGGTIDVLLNEMKGTRLDGTTARDDIDKAMEAAFLELTAPRRDYTPELLSEDQILARPPMSYIVEPFIPRGMATVIFGAPGSGKTFFGQDMGSAVRRGGDWHGHSVARGAVLLLEAEGLEQLQARIVAWKEFHGSPELAAFAALDDPLDLSSPAGAAALVRTVLGMEKASGEKVELVWVDPAALYMAGSENDDGNRNLALGLNAVAKYLNIGVLLIVHTNASGERARGTDHFRMLSGSYIRVEKLDEERFGAVQEKVKNTFPHAIILRAQPVGSSLVLTDGESMSAAAYEGRKSSRGYEEKITLRLSEAQRARSMKDSLATELLIEAVRKQPGIVQGKLLAACKNRGVGHDGLDATLQSLVHVSKRIRVEVTGTGKNAAHHHYLADAETP